MARWMKLSLPLPHEKILAYKASLSPNLKALDTVGSPAHRAESARITRAAITSVNDAPFELGERPLFLGCYRFRPTMVSSPEDTSLSFPFALQALLGGGAIATPQNPTTEEIEQVLANAKGYTSIVVGTYNGRLREGQMALVHAASTLGLPMCVVALRNPYDLSGLPKHVRTIAAYDYDVRTLPVVAEILSGKAVPVGKLPVRL